MRRLIGRSAAVMAAMAMGVAAHAARAADTSLGAPPLVATSAIVPAMPAALATPAAPGFSLETLVGPAAQAAQPAQPDFRLHAVGQASPAQPTLDSQTARLRRGFGGAMADYYPLGVDGFHLSGGSRFYSRGPARAGVVDARGLVDMRYVTLLYAPRSVLARATRRMTPALTAGYTRLLQGGLSLGIEGGAMLGKFDTLAGSLVRPPRLRGAGLGDGADRISQIARMTFGYRF